MRRPPWLYKHCKNRTGLLHGNVQTDQPKLYCPGPKTRRFENYEINEMMVQKVMKPAQTEWAASVVFATKNERNFAILSRQQET